MDVIQRQTQRREAKRQSANRRYHAKQVSVWSSFLSALLVSVSRGFFFLVIAKAASGRAGEAVQRQLAISATQPSITERPRPRRYDRRLATRKRGVTQASAAVFGFQKSTGPASGCAAVAIRHLSTRAASNEDQSAQHPSEERTQCQECHAIARKGYSEIVAFSAGGTDSLISTGASVFGWTDQRQVDNGLLKFSLTKLNTRMSPEEASSALWALSTSPSGNSKLNSPSMDMRTVVVQVVDHSNVVIWEEYQVQSNVGSVTTITIVRALVLLTLFATESGYILLAYGLDPELAIYPANDYLSPLLGGNTNIKYAWQPVFCWTELNRVEESPHQCLSSFVGTFPVEGANFVHWAVEVLLMVLRAESILLGPQWTLP